MNVRRTKIKIRPDCKRVLIRSFGPFGDERNQKIISRILALSESDAAAELNHVMNDFQDRHPRLGDFFLQRYRELRPFIDDESKVNSTQQSLIGAYFSSEYSIEAAALFNPSMVWHPDQSNVPPNKRRFILSLRATGEGHISSLTFRSGLIDPGNAITIDTPADRLNSPELISAHPAQKSLFSRESPGKGWIEDASNYEICFSRSDDLSSRVIFPVLPEERNGIEDARFVQFRTEDERMTFYATYTAYDGKHISSRLLETEDFIRFRSRALRGASIANKGLALFPRKINGRYVMLSRQDNENIFLMQSDQLLLWDSKKLLLEPMHPWEFIQLGNCGSPMETEAGWLVLSHAVGPMRRYAISAFLLDLDDPGRIIGRLKQPLLLPAEEEREGYVPNVVYSCGGVIHGRTLIIPYAMSDSVSSVATVNLDELLKELDR